MAGRRFLAPGRGSGFPALRSGGMVPDLHPQGTASVLLLRSLVAGARELGISTAELGQQLGIASSELAAEALADADARVPSAWLVALWNYLPTRCPDESFGFWLAERLQAPPLSLSSWLISNSATLGEGFEHALRFQRLLHDDARSELVRTDSELSYRHQIGVPPFRAPSPAIEF